MTVIISYNMLSSYGQYYNDKKIGSLELKKKYILFLNCNISYTIYIIYTYIYV